MGEGRSSRGKNPRQIAEAAKQPRHRRRVDVATLESAGVKYVFGIPGTNEVGFMNALVDHPNLQFILGLHEGPLTAMADGYSKVSGETAFVLVHTVAGAANGLAQLSNSWIDGTPIVFTAGNQDSRLRGRAAFPGMAGTGSARPWLRKMVLGNLARRFDSRNCSPGFQSGGCGSARTRFSHHFKRLLEPDKCQIGDICRKDGLMRRPGRSRSSASRTSCRSVAESEVPFALGGRRNQ